MKVENIRAKRVLKYDPSQRKFRLFRVMWEANSGPGPSGYSAKAAVSLVPKLFGLKVGSDDARITAMGVQLHMRRSYGGRFT